jgi:hypothetical protein
MWTVVVIAILGIVALVLFIPLELIVRCERRPWFRFHLGFRWLFGLVNKHIEPKYILAVMKNRPQLFSDMPPIPAGICQVDIADPDRTNRRGFRVNGKVLPVENRHFGHWNTDPWALDYGGNGNELAAGTVFLLPYYMGLYHGYIEKP